MKKQLREGFEGVYGYRPSEIFFSPGRVNLIGEHIDYNGGMVLPAAISLGIWGAVGRRNDRVITIYAESFKEKCTWEIDDLPGLDTVPSWARVVYGMLVISGKRGAKPGGADIYVYSNLPIASGLSSSAAMECLAGMIFAEDYYSSHRKELALDAQKAEHEYAKVMCGIMDQFAIAHGKDDHAVLLDTSNLEYSYIPTKMKEHTLVIINSNTPRVLADSRYNARREECKAALEAIRQFVPAEDLCHANQMALAYIEDDVLYRRAKHAITENMRVHSSLKALQEGDMESFGHLLTSSHKSLAQDFEVSSKELDTIVHFATHHPACLGARMTGAGFGGCCIALVEKGSVKLFNDFVGKKYTEKTGRAADFYEVDFVDGVSRIE